MAPVNTGDDYSRNSAEEGNVAKDNHFATTGDLAKDGRLAFSSDGDITNVGNFAKKQCCHDKRFCQEGVDADKDKYCHGMQLCQWG
jgi:hypothetical protein